MNKRGSKSNQKSFFLIMKKQWHGQLATNLNLKLALFLIIENQKNYFLYQNLRAESTSNDTRYKCPVDGPLWIWEPVTPQNSKTQICGQCESAIVINWQFLLKHFQESCRKVYRTRFQRIGFLSRHYYYVWTWNLKLIFYPFMGVFSFLNPS